VEISYSKAIYCKGMHNHQGLLKVKNKQVIIMDILDIVDEGYPIEEGKDVYFIDSADLRNYNFFNADLRLANLVGADLRGANLDAADLSGANLTNANLTGVQLTTAWVQVVTDDFASDTSGTSFEWHIPSLRHANLTNANLTDANLVGASLLYADLSGADLSGADLSGTDLSVTDLSDALLTGANLYKTTGLGNLTSDQLASTVSKAPTPTIDLNDADGTLVAYEILYWPVFTGHSFPGTTVTLVSTYADTNTSESYTTTADADGKWSIDQDDVGELPPDGRFSLSVTATDSDGLVSDAATAALIFDLGTAGGDFDAPTINLNDDDGVITSGEYDSWVGLTGTAAANSTVILVSTERETGQKGTLVTQADADGNWSVSPNDDEAQGDEDEQSEGSFAISVTYTDNIDKISEAATTSISFDSQGHGSDDTNDADTFKVTAAGGKYFIDGEQAPVLELQSGKKYEFDLSDSSLVSPNHPLKFKLDGQTWNEGVEVTGRLGVDQIVTITVPDASEGILSYYCENHSGMGNDINTYDVNTQNPSTDTEISGSSDSEVLEGSDGDDVISGGDGSDLILAGAGDDTITVGGSQTFSSFHQAVNTSSTTQVGTGDKVTLEGMLRIEDVIDGGADTDTIELGEGNVALFLHDAFSGFNSSVQLSSDSTGEHSKARLENIEKITGSDGNNIIDLTSPDYSLAEQSIEVDGGLGADIIWGSDADETIKGGEGDDELFGGAGTNVLTGGLGADEFQFTMTSKNDSVTDFNAAEGDTLKFFNTGGAEFDKSSAILSDGKLKIDYGSDANDHLTIDLGNTALNLSDVSDSLILV
jgi:hypothetical protein